MHTHFDIFIEDISGKHLVDILMAKILPNEGYSYRVHPYRGCGKLPENLSAALEIRAKTLLNNVPRLIKGFVNTYKNIPDYRAVFVILTDNDNRHCADYKAQILSTINSQTLIPVKNTIVCLAIEEMEAWLLGDFEAIMCAYPSANQREYTTYVQDSVCGTWEKLARVIDDKLYNKKLKDAPFYIVGEKKSEWAKNITPHLDINNNLSPSFNYFLRKILRYVN